MKTFTTSRLRARFLTLFLVLTTLLLLAACGGQSQPAAEAPAAEPTAAPAEEAAAEPTEAPAEEAAVEPTEAPAEEAAAEATEAPAEEAAAEPTEAPAEEAAAAPTEAPAEEAAADPDPVAADSDAPAVELPAAAAQAPRGTVTAEAGVNVRTGPGLGYDIIGVAPQGTEGEIIGVSADGQWWVASVPDAPNGQGWVAAAHVEATDADAVPVIDAPPMAAVVTLPAQEPVQAPDELDPEGVIVFSASRVLQEGNRVYDLEDIYTVPTQPGASATLIIQNAMQPSVLRDGNIMAFRSVQSDQLGLSAYDFDTDARVRYSSHLEDSTPRWSPTGDRLVFSSNRTGDRLWHIYIMEPVPGDDRAGFADATDLGFGKDADWHPTGEVIVFKGCDDSGQNCGLWTINSDGSERSQLTDGFNDSLPRWSPDGESIVFMSDSRDGNWELYTLSVADGSVTRLTEDDAEDGLPAWSPDGSRIAFMSKRGGAWGIWVMPAAGGDAEQITQLEEQLPDWLLQGIDWPR
ncbi:MAG: PD40 domain-containing protein [Caldilineaceae bacterium]|nr:PD40 domain-containing protein [Caldilineaceae bacterium]